MTLRFTENEVPVAGNQCRAADPPDLNYCAAWSRNFALSHVVPIQNGSERRHAAIGAVGRPWRACQALDLFSTTGPSGSEEIAVDIASTKAIERIARVLAGQRLSSNGSGDDPHAGGQVDASWRHHREDAIAILKAMREPDEDMERAGDIAVWQRMIAAAIGEASMSTTRPPEPPEPGTDPLNEGP